MAARKELKFRMPAEARLVALDGLRRDAGADES